MLLEPESVEDLADRLRRCPASERPVKRIDLSRLNRLVEHCPEDMTATVETGLSLAAFQEIVGQHGQWLPLDPPSMPDGASPTIAEVLAQNLSGPRRYGYGLARDYLIGARIALADGQLIKAGGKVVKNVAGYDLAKLFIGAKHSLGVIGEATFKLRPRPEREVLLSAQFLSIDALRGAAAALAGAPVEPVILDAHNLEGAFTWVVGLAGTGEELAYQVEIAREFGLREGGSLEHEEKFWREAGPVRKTSVLPSTLSVELARLGTQPWVARYGNGLVYHRVDRMASEPKMANNSNGLNHSDDSNRLAESRRWIARVKERFDPERVLPDYL